MKANLIFLLNLVVCVPLLSYTQDLEEADKILRVAREAIYKQVLPVEVKGFRLIKDSQTAINKMPAVKLEKTIEISFPKQIKITSKNFIPSFDSENTDNYTKRVLTSNGKKVSLTAFVAFDGQEEKVNARDAFKQMGLSKKAIEKRLREKREKFETKKRAIEEAWLEVFPLFLMDPWEAERKFKFIGIARVGGKTKKVLDLVRTENEKEENLKAGVKDFIRLFFDEKTLLLTHVNGETETKENKVALKLFFSDYQEMEGLLVAKKINMEAITTQKNGSQQRIIQQITVKDFKLNPVFKAGTFEVKKEKL